ncbi:hypothetical protein [Amycolatopsis sp. A1MSW2902]|uniref:hypothetical protein n=1 Tax=Amycolatopsis sp. A1MSW2902 TaxID=687413 RepID=UPI00307F0C59
MESDVRACSLQPVIKFLVAVGELVNLLFERDVLGCDTEDRIFGAFGLHVANLTHQVADVFALLDNLLVGSLQRGLCVERSFSPRGLDFGFVPSIRGCAVGLLRPFWSY